MRLPSLLVLLAACLALAGCLESSKDRYIADYEPLNDRLVEVNEEMVSALNAASPRRPERLAGQLAPLSGEFTRLSRQIGALDTPEDLRQESKALTRSLEATGAGVSRTATLARRADRPALAAATVDLADDVNGVVRAARRLARATGAES